MFLYILVVATKMVKVSQSSESCFVINPVVGVIRLNYSNRNHFIIVVFFF